MPDHHGDAEPGMDASIVCEDASSELPGDSIPKIIHGMTKHQFRDVVLNPLFSYSTSGGTWQAYANSTSVSSATAGSTVLCFPLNLGDSDVAQGTVNLYTYIQLDKAVARVHNYQYPITQQLGTSSATSIGVLVQMMAAFATGNPLGAPNVTWVNRATTSPPPSNAPVSVWNGSVAAIADHVGAIKFPVTQTKDILYVITPAALNHFVAETFNATSGGGLPTIGSYAVMPGHGGARIALDPTQSYNNQYALNNPSGFFYIAMPASTATVVVALSVSFEYFFTCYLPY
jgi:hypothetical protein